MKSTSIRILTTLMLSLTLTPFALAHKGHDQNNAKAETSAPGAFIKADEAGVSTEWLAKAKAAYPLDTCMVSEDKLEDGDMGPPVDYVYRQESKPDRLVRLCCNHCVRDFKKDPAKYLKMIDEAAAAKPRPAPANSTVSQFLQGLTLWQAAWVREGCGKRGLTRGEAL